MKTCWWTTLIRENFLILQDIEGIAKAGKVDCTSERYLCQQAGVRAYPTVRFYKGATKRGSNQVKKIRRKDNKTFFHAHLN